MEVQNANAKLSDSEKDQDDTFEDPNKGRGSQSPPAVGGNQSGEDNNAATPTGKKVSLADNGEDGELDDEYALNPPTTHKQLDTKPAGNLPQVDGRHVYLTAWDRKQLLAEFFRVIETFCEKQESENWKDRIVNLWKDRGIQMETIKQIGDISWDSIPIPGKEDQKFEF